jgi:hypothetical protein
VHQYAEDRISIAAGPGLRILVSNKVLEPSREQEKENEGQEEKDEEPQIENSAEV